MPLHAWEAEAGHDITHAVSQGLPSPGWLACVVVGLTTLLCGQLALTSLLSAEGQRPLRSKRMHACMGITLMPVHQAKPCMPWSVSYACTRSALLGSTNMLCLDVRGARSPLSCPWLT